MSKRVAWIVFALGFAIACVGPSFPDVPAPPPVDAQPLPPLLNGFVFQSAATTGNGAVADLGGQNREVAVYVTWSAGVSAGAITVETADDPVYTGTWAPLATITFSGTAPKADVVQVSGVMKAVRSRISTTVTGGTATSKGYGN